MSNSMLLVMVEILFVFFVSYYFIRGQLIINECTLQSFSVNQNIYDLFGSPDSPSPNQNKLNFILTTVTVRIGWNLTCKQYDGFGVADLVPGSVFSNEKSPSLSNHSGSYQNHPPSCPALTELSWSDLRLSTGLPKTGTFWFQVAPIPFCVEQVV